MKGISAEPGELRSFAIILFVSIGSFLVGLDLGAIGGFFAMAKYFTQTILRNVGTEFAMHLMQI